jgi:glycine/D-amino acid oxidase-like deaminating enzyme
VGLTLAPFAGKQISELIQLGRSTFDLATLLS